MIRETAAQFEKPALLFSGGKDSIVMAHVACKAFHPAPLPFPLLHIDTGHNFQETLEFRDRFVARISARLVVGSVQKSIDRGRVQEDTGPHASRNALQIVTLLDTIEEHGFDACLGGGRRDEEKARAKERFFSHRDRFGQWNPKNQRPEIWNLYNGLKAKSENFRVFPLSNWTEIDIWRYIKAEDIELPSLYFAAERPCLKRDGAILMISEIRRTARGRDRRTKEHTVSHHGRRHDHRCGRIEGFDARCRSRRGCACSGHGARQPRGRQGHDDGDGGSETRGILLAPRFDCLSDDVSRLVRRPSRTKPRLFRDGASIIPAASYSPTGLPLQYHRL